MKKKRIKEVGIHHPYQVMPDPRPEEFRALKADILERGIRHPIVFDNEGNILDGHTRKRAWEELRAEGHDVPPFPRTVREDVTSDVEKRTAARRENSTRRHLNTRQKQSLAEAQLKDTPHYSNAVIGRWIGVSEAAVRAYRHDLEIAKEIPYVEVTYSEDGKPVGHRRKDEGELPKSRAQRKATVAAARVRNAMKSHARAKAAAETLDEKLASGRVAEDVELPSATLTAEQEAFYAIASYFLPLATKEPEAVADAAVDIAEVNRALDDADDVLAWLTRYRDALKERSQAKLEAVSH